MSRVAFALALLAIGSGGCKSNFEPVCASILLPAVSVSVLDARTNAPPLVASTLYVSEGAYMDSAVTAVLAGGAHIAAAAYGRPGTYTIVIRTPGYADWTKSSLQVVADACGKPHTANVSASILPLGS